MSVLHVHEKYSITGENETNKNNSVPAFEELLIKLGKKTERITISIWCDGWRQSEKMC